MVYRIVIIEDEPIIRKGLKLDIHKICKECEVIAEGKDGHEAIEVINRYKPDIVLIDINIPHLNGLEVLKKTRDIPYQAIVISGYDVFEYARLSIQMNVVSYLLKPVKPDELKKSIDKAISKVEEFHMLKSESNLNKEMFFEKIQRNNKKDPFEKKIEKYINENFDKSLNAEVIADHLEMSRTTLNNEIKKRYGKTFQEFIFDTRMRQAVHLLETTDEPIYLVASMVGYKDYAYFSKVFKEYYGVTATEAREYFRKVLNNGVN